MHGGTISVRDLLRDIGDPEKHWHRDDKTRAERLARLGEALDESGSRMLSPYQEGVIREQCRSLWFGPSPREAEIIFPAIASMIAAFISMNGHRIPTRMLRAAKGPSANGSTPHVNQDTRDAARPPFI